MIRFYAPDILTTGSLPEIESGHAIRVLRHRVGDTIEVVDGNGMLYHCILVSEHPKHAAVEITQATLLPKVWAPNICLAVAPTKQSDRMEWLVEKAVEIGVDTFVPILTARSERKQLNIERLEKIAVSAMKQSLKAVLPVVKPMQPIAHFLNEVSATSQKFVGWCDSTTERNLLACTCRPKTDTTILIGPEGDFTSDEIASAIKAGFTPVTMGDNRLRTETAALVALDTVHIVNQVFS